MTSFFKGQPPKTRPKLQSKQGSFGFQVYIYIYVYIYILYSYNEIFAEEIGTNFIELKSMNRIDSIKVPKVGPKWSINVLLAYQGY